MNHTAESGGMQDGLHTTPETHPDLRSKYPRLSGQDAPQPDTPPALPFNGFSPPTSNFSPLPHQLIEAFPLFETKAEVLLVLYILRHTWGYHDDDKRITVDEFMRGRKRKDGTRIDSGVGMGKAAVIEGLRRAAKHGFITVDVDDSDKARVEKRYKLCVDEGYENRTPAVRKSHPGGTKSIQRSEKETSERNSKKDSIASGDAGAPKAKPRNPVFDAIAQHIFSIDPNRVNGKGGRIGAISSWLEGKNAGMKHINVGFISEPATAEQVVSFAGWYKVKTNGGADMPQGFSTFVEWWRKWETAGKPATPTNGTKTALQRTLEGLHEQA